MLTEDQLERQCLCWFQDGGWDALFGPNIAHDGPTPERADYLEVVLVGRLNRALARLNPLVPAPVLEEAALTLLKLDHPVAEQRNRAFYRLLLNGLPVSVQTVVFGEGLVASRVRFTDDDLETAAMIRGATAQRFAEHDVAIEENAAATEALRGRVGDIDQYNIRGTTNVYFDTGRWQLTPASQAELCEAAREAGAMNNALLLVVGYTDNVGDQEFNQTLSERRAGRVVNHLQQDCRWAPYRMLTPAGMAESDPLADNTTPAGRAQNRRVAVHIMVSKAVEGL